MGIGCGQGYFFGRPHAQPARSVTDDARDALRAGHIAVFPETTRTLSSASPSGGMASAKMLVHAPALPRHATNNDVLELFNRLPDLHAVAVVEHDEPVALINRRSFMDRYALPYHRELFGKRPCLLFANASPVIIEKSMTRRADGQAARERRPALSRRRLRHHRQRQIRRSRHRREPRARGDRGAHRSGALRESADLPAGQHPDQFAHCAACSATTPASTRATST